MRDKMFMVRNVTENKLMDWTPFMTLSGAKAHITQRRKQESRYRNPAYRTYSNSELDIHEFELVDRGVVATIDPVEE